MPHAHPLPTAPPNRAEPDRPAEPAPAIRASPVCPSCGRRPAVVFPDLRAGTAAGAAPLVCLKCCPQVWRGDGGPTPGG